MSDPGRRPQPRPAPTTADDYYHSDDEDVEFMPMMPPDFLFTGESRASSQEQHYVAYDYAGDFPFYSGDDVDWAVTGFDLPSDYDVHAIPAPAGVAAGIQGGVEADDLERILDGLRLVDAFGPDEDGADELFQFQAMVTAGELLLGYMQASGLSGRLWEGLDGDDDDDDDDDAYANGGFGAVPASAASVAALETHTYGGGGGAVNNDDGARCVICIEDFEVGDDLSVVPCSYRHSFHRSCLAEWLARSRFCPLCRHALPAEGAVQHQHTTEEVN